MRILIVEDFPPVAKGIARTVSDLLGAELERVDIVGDIAGAKKLLGRHPVDLVLLDLNLQGKDGFEILRWAAAGSFETVVISANTHRALTAFEHGVLDFVSKPVLPERLRLALDRVRHRNASLAAGPSAKRLWVRRRGGLVSVPVTEIRYIQGAGKYAELHLVDGRRLLHERRLERLASILPEHFQRAHRSYIVNLRRVERLRIERGGRYTLELEDGDEIPVSRTRIETIREHLS